MVSDTKLGSYIVLAMWKTNCNLKNSHALHLAKFGGFTVLSF